MGSVPGVDGWRGRVEFTRGAIEAYHGHVPLEDRSRPAARASGTTRCRRRRDPRLGGADRLVLEHRREPRACGFLAFGRGRDLVVRARGLGERGLRRRSARRSPRDRDCACALCASARARAACAPACSTARASTAAPSTSAGAGAVVRIVRERARRIRRRPARRAIDRAADEREVGAVLAACEVGELVGGDARRRRAATRLRAALGSRRSRRVGHRVLDRGELGVVDVGVGDRRSARAARRAPAASPCAASARCDLGLGEQHRDALAILDRDVAVAARRSPSRRLLDLLDAVVEHAAELARELEAPVGARGVDRDVAGGLVGERLLRVEPGARRGARVIDLAERVERLGDVELRRCRRGRRTATRSSCGSVVQCSCASYRTGSPG